MEILSLPIFPEMTEAQVSYVTDSIREFYDVKKCPMSSEGRCETG